MSSEGQKSQNPRGKLEPTPVETQTVPTASRRSSASILRDTSRSAISAQQDTMSSGPKISSVNALGLSTSAESAGTLNPTRNHVSQHDSPSSPIISSTTSEEVWPSRHQAQAARLENASYSAEVILPEAIPFPMGPSQFDFSRNPTAFTPLDLQTTTNNVTSQARREAALRSLMIKFPVLRTRSPIHPLLRCASEILHIDDRMGNVLITLSMEELVELQELHLAVKKELRPWFRCCQMPKPWRGNRKSCATWTQREGGLYLSAWPFLAIGFESRAETPAVEAYQAIICQVFQGTVSWSELLLILEDRERYRQMDYDVKKAWLRTLFVIATVRPPFSGMTGGSLPKQPLNHKRRTQLSLDSSHHSPPAGSSSPSVVRPSTKAFRKESCARPIAIDTDSRKRNGRVPPSSVSGNPLHAGSFRSGTSAHTNGKNGGAIKPPVFVDDMKSSVGITDERASSGIGRFYISPNEDCSEVDSDGSPSLIPRATTSTDATLNSQDQSVPTSPPTSYVADTKPAGNESDVSCPEPKTGIGADAPLNVIRCGQGTNVLPSRSSLTERLASLPPDQRPAPFYPGSLLQLQQQHRHTADQNMRNIEGSSGPTRMRPSLRTEPFPDRSDPQIANRGIQPNVARRQSPFAPRHFLREDGSSDHPGSCYCPADRNSNPYPSAGEDRQALIVNHSHVTIQARHLNPDDGTQPTSAGRQPPATRPDLLPQNEQLNDAVRSHHSGGVTTDSAFDADDEFRRGLTSNVEHGTVRAERMNSMTGISTAATEQEHLSRLERADGGERRERVAALQTTSEQVSPSDNPAPRSVVGEVNGIVDLTGLSEAPSAIQRAV